MGNETSPVIEINLNNGDLVARLKAKAAEYEERKEQDGRYKAPEQLLHFTYRLQILEVLLRDGSVETYALSREVKAESGNFDAETWNTACAVIVDYIETGGQNLLGGTGLPQAS